MRKIVLDEQVVRDLRDEVNSLLCHWETYDNGPDYCCHFCGALSKSNVDLTIEHDDTCSGIAYMKTLDEALK